ncbi:MAG: hypothetical protein PUG60_12340 [Lachnospiraceae bacterium]|nr:hypothetical protein [Lachnospiraceae bacterium]MDY4970842.1 hypothetical protein [Lachnospiraceae bacterium]
MTHKKNGFLTFICSLFPGVGEMYLGFMKQGISLMALFFGICALCSFFRFDAGLFILPIVWCYSFFHVHNLKSLTDEEFRQVEDDFLIRLPEHTELYLSRKKQLILAWACIIIGAYALLNILLDMLYRIIPSWLYDMIYDCTYLLPQIILSLLLIALGVHLIRGKKTQLDLEKDENERFAEIAFHEDDISYEREQKREE